MKTSSEREEEEETRDEILLGEHFACYHFIPISLSIICLLDDESLRISYNSAKEEEECLRGFILLQ